MRRDREKVRKKKRKIVWTRFLPFVILCAILLYSGKKIIDYKIETKANRINNEELERAFEEAKSTNETAATKTRTGVTIESGDDVLPKGDAAPVMTIADEIEEKSTPQYIGDKISDSIAETYKKNNDLVGWLQIPNVVSCPVVYRDNAYYIDHDFYGRKNVSGALFLDELTPFEAETPTLLIHGHNMHNGEMFGNVSHYTNKQYAAQNMYMSFNTLYRTEYYVLVGAIECDLNDPEGTDYYNCALYSPKIGWDFEYFKQLWDNKAIYQTGAAINESDAMVTLSTCLDGSERLLVLFRRVREDETREELDQLIERAE